MKNLKTYGIIAVCVCSALAGISFGYFVFGRVLANVTDLQASEYLPDFFEEEVLNSKETPIAVYAEAPTVEIAIEEVPTVHVDLPEEIYKFIVSSLDGYIVIYHATTEGNHELKEKTVISVNALPFIEQQRLSNGIMVYSEEALIRILEDYGS